MEKHNNFLFDIDINSPSGCILTGPEGHVQPKGHCSAVPDNLSPQACFAL